MFIFACLFVCLFVCVCHPQDSRFMFWRPCVFVGRRVCVSALRVCSLRGWAGHRVLSVTSQSRLVLLTHQPGTADETETEQSIGLSPQESCTDMQTLPSDAQTSGAEEQPAGVVKETDTKTQREEALRGASADAHVACAVKVKHSKVISYKVRRGTKRTPREETYHHGLENLSILLCHAK